MDTLPWNIWGRVIAFSNVGTLETLVNARPRFMMEMEPDVVYCPDFLTRSRMTTSVPTIAQFCRVEWAVWTLAELALLLREYKRPIHGIYLLNVDEPIFRGTVFPSNLHTLNLGSEFNYPIATGVLPVSLKVLIFGVEFNQKIRKGVLPPMLEELKLGYSFNRAIGVGVLPQSLRKLSFGKSYEWQIGKGVLPPNLFKLSLSPEYEGPMDTGVLPESLHTLSLDGASFDFGSPIRAGVFPPNIHTLILRSDFSRFLGKGVLPSSLRKIVLKFGDENDLRDWRRELEPFLRDNPRCTIEMITQH